MLSSKVLEVTSNKKNKKVVKRVFDIFFSFFLITLFFIPILVLAFFSTIQTKEFGIFTQKRIGYKGLIFNIYKIRTICSNGQITRFGSYLRKTKLNELPQFFNILKGDMSFVGPRPDVIGYADKLKGEDRIILSMRPGLTGPATLKFINEEKELLVSSNSKELMRLYWEEKVEINKNYIRNNNVFKDIKYLIKTLICMFNIVFGNER